MSATTKLTKPQQALLERVQREGTVRLNGRATKTVNALKDAGLVNAEYDLIPHAIGKWTELWIVTRKDPA